MNTILKSLTITAAFVALPSLALACGPQNVEVTKAGPTTVKKGEPIVYTVTLTQKSSGHATNVRVIDTIPSGLTFRAHNPNDPNSSSIDCTQKANTIECSPNNQTENEDINEGPSLRPFSTLIFKIAFNVTNTPTPDQCVIQNFFQFISEESQKTSNTVTTTIENCLSTPTPTPSTTPTPTPTPTPGLEVEKTDGEDRVRPGENVTYTLTVRNTGKVNLTDIEVRDEVPSELEHISADNGGHVDGRIVTWKISLNAGKEEKLHITARVKQNTTATDFCNEVTVKDKDHGLEDSAKDCTDIEKPEKPKVKAAVVTPKPAAPVPITAKTGAGVVGTLATLAGGLGITLVKSASAKRSASTLVLALAIVGLGSLVGAPAYAAGNEVLSVSFVDRSWVDGDGTLTFRNNGTIQAAHYAGTSVLFGNVVTNSGSIPFRLDLVAPNQVGQLPGNWSTVSQISLNIPGSVPRLPTPHCDNETTPHGPVGVSGNGTSTVVLSFHDGDTDLCGPLQIGGFATLMVTGNSTQTITTTSSTKSQCSDGIDNDNDGKVDMNDPGCENGDDNDETDKPKSKGKLEVTKSDGKTSVRPGAELKYTITVKNTGEADIHDLKITDRLPEHVQVVSVTPHTSWNKNTDTIVWENRKLGAGATDKYTVTLRVNDNVSNNTQLINEVTAKSNDHGAEASAKDDDTEVKRNPAIAAAVVVKKPITPVKVTAKTGAGEIGLLLTALGAAGLILKRTVA